MYLLVLLKKYLVLLYLAPLKVVYRHVPRKGANVCCLPLRQGLCRIDTQTSELGKALIR
jgi:hypothetical protein